MKILSGQGKSQEQQVLWKKGGRGRAGSKGKCSDGGMEKKPERRNGRNLRNRSAGLHKSKNGRKCKYQKDRGHHEPIPFTRPIKKKGMNQGGGGKKKNGQRSLTCLSKRRGIVFGVIDNTGQTDPRKKRKKKRAYGWRAGIRRTYEARRSRTLRG